MDTRATTVVVAIPSASKDLIKSVVDRCSDLDVAVKVLPPFAESFASRADVRDVRDVDMRDLLGRAAVDIDLAAVAGYVTGKRVLVTGAGGSIGSELCRQLHRFGPAELIMLDRDESALHAVQLSIHGRALLDSPDVVLNDIRDEVALRRIFEDRRPEVVFHAAALKHLPMLEQYPDEAMKTNVLGTANVLEAAAAVGVTTFVNISTDKAADPTSVLGYSKRVAERLTADMAAPRRGRLHQRPLRQRPRLPRVGAAHLHGADRGGRTGHGDAPRGHPLLHDGRGGGPARHPGRRHR